MKPKTFAERKKERTEYFETCVKGWKLRTCPACNGRGYYDDTDSPKCECCDGTGKVRIKKETII